MRSPGFEFPLNLITRLSPGLRADLALIYVCIYIAWKASVLTKLDDDRIFCTVGEYEMDIKS